MVLRYATVVFAAAVLATVVALSVSALGPKEAGAATTTTVMTCGGGNVTLKVREQRTLKRHNRLRKNHGLRHLCVNRALTKAARTHSAEMVKKDYFGHNSYSGKGVGARLRRYGYDWRVYGENIAGGAGRLGKPGPIFRRWMNSSHHRANILKGRFRQVGVGIYRGNYKGQRGYTMYTVDFGTQR